MDSYQIRRHKRPNYRLLNDGSNNEADPKDYITSESDYYLSESFQESSQQASNLSLDINTSNLSIPSSITPYESISQIQSLQPSNVSYSQVFQPRKKARLEQSSWLWNMFLIVPRENETFIDPRSKKTKQEKDIYCQYSNCTWKILESKRGGSTSNLAHHLSSKYNIIRDNPSREISKQQSSLLGFIKPNRTQPISPEII